MLKVNKVEARQSKIRLAVVKVKYYDLIISCDVCLYRNEKIWIRMPEMWVTKEKKKRFCWWPTPELSEEFQKVIVEEVCKQLDLTLEKAIEMKKNFKSKKKK